MRKAAWLIAAALLVVLGLIIFAAAMTANHWNFSKLSTTKYETNTHEIKEDFSNISINTDTADILLVPSDDGICKVVCTEEANLKHSVTVQDGTLTIDTVDERTWYEHIGITIGTPKITIYLPNTEYTSLFINEDTGDVEIPKQFKFERMDILTDTGDVNNYASASKVIQIKTSTGYIHVENVSTNMLDLSVSTGNIAVSGAVCESDVNIHVSTGRTNMTDVTCKNLLSSGNTGDIFLKNVIAAGTCSIERSTGDVSFEQCDAAEIFVKTDTGDVTGSMCSEKVFITETSTGDVHIPKSTTGGRCEITTSTGDISITVQ